MWGINCLRRSSRSSRVATRLNLHLHNTLSRLEPLRRYHQTRCSQAREDVAQLLRLGHISYALFRAEFVIKELNMIDIIAMIESYCLVLIEHNFLLSTERECPEELWEAAGGVIFASYRCGDLPELREICRIFSSWFGKKFIAAATMLENNCCVDERLMLSFSTRQPSLERRAIITKEIATMKNIKVEIADPTSEIAERENRAKTTLEPQFTACGGYEDAESAIQAAFKLATQAAAAALAAKELFRLEIERMRSDNPDRSPSSSCSKDKDLG